ncbi:hypothetical protein AZE42_13155 [Rhizopogon vesiculosus]|uniref:Uncharacterized protein n=1 Tax=Rhizopogon vesiculosus TaxID=180088 RepID=A0A1J8QPU8_9AGAM|nr:hypothetical protein AZE42_13155 [Rhizopogon vesiculosus]
MLKILSAPHVIRYGTGNTRKVTVKLYGRNRSQGATRDVAEACRAIPPYSSQYLGLVVHISEDHCATDASFISKLPFSAPESQDTPRDARDSRTHSPPTRQALQTLQTPQNAHPSNTHFTFSGDMSRYTS